MVLYRRLRQLFVVLTAALLLASCTSDREGRMFDLTGERAEVSSYTAKAKTHFAEGHFGLAESKYRQAVEKNPDDAEAWLGLAASYDELRRFELADRAYTQVRKLVGETPTVLNNMGYSQMLRGDLAQAERYINLAYEQEPENPVIQRNMGLLSRKLGRAG